MLNFVHFIDKQFCFHSCSQISNSCSKFSSWYCFEFQLEIANFQYNTNLVGLLSQREFRVEAHLERGQRDSLETPTRERVTCAPEMQDKWAVKEKGEIQMDAWIH